MCLRVYIMCPKYAHAKLINLSNHSDEIISLFNIS